jgi:hypothetical protein
MLQSFKIRLGIVAELFAFLWQRKLWWLIPMIALLVVLGVLFVLAQAHELRAP